MSVEIPVVNAGTQYVDNLNLSWVSTSSFSLSNGAARDSTGSNDIILSSLVTINSGDTGLNGLDTGFVQIAHIYHVFVIGASSQNFPTGGLMSASQTAPLLPFGYDMFRRIGSVRTDGIGNITQFTVGGNGKDRFYYYSTLLNILTGGNSTAPTNVSLANIIPTTASVIKLDASYTPAGATNIASIRPVGTLAASGLVQLGCGVAGLQVVAIECPSSVIGGIPAISYFVTAAGDSLTLNVIGYIDNL